MNTGKHTREVAFIDLRIQKRTRDLAKRPPRKTLRRRAGCSVENAKINRSIVPARSDEIESCGFSEKNGVFSMKT